VLVELLIFLYFILKEPVMTAIFSLLSPVPIGFFWLEYNKPVLRIKKETEAEIIYFEVSGEKIIELDDGLFSPYTVIRIVVENMGRSAAKKCKGYFVTDKSRERICWTIPAEMPNATINVEDNERLDFCAFPMDVSGNNTIILPTEEGWDNRRHTGPINICKVLVTSENAEPVEANVKIDINQRKVEIG
jgi:hypothetical protein